MASQVPHPSQVSHPVFARVWPRLSRQLEQRGARDRRRQLLAGLRGEVVEVGVGTGVSFGHYPDAVTRVRAIEPEPRLRALAEQAAHRASVRVEVLDGVASRLPIDDDSADAVVTSLVLCSVPDLRAALEEIARVLLPDGRLRFFEHVVAQGAGHRRVQRLLDATIWPRLGGGCHTARDTTTAIEAAGMRITDLERFRFPDGPLPMPISPHVLGEAIPAEWARPAPPNA